MRVRLLVSYHYHRGTDLAAMVDSFGGDVDLFADSGAYSAATTGATIRLADYAAWLRDWAPLWTVRAGLDVIGDHEATARNTDALRAAGADVMPVFHVGEPWDVLEDLCAANRYVALGGMALHAVGASKQKPLMRWLVRCFQIAVPHGTRFHGFGLTSAQLVKNLPFYSVDSSSYTLGIRWGLAYLWNAPTLRMESVLFRNPDEVRPHAELFRAHGLDPAAVVRPDFMRAGTPGFTSERAAVGAAGARAYVFMERTLTARHAVPPPPLPRCDDHGTKVYLAVGDTDQPLLLRALVEQPEAIR
ncbi:hypothetical protein [Streptomyces salinarius]|uniref:hypothetical protein n=1 Tax=Streptomyces salinarius TaxID=2762598 RepID=UPI0028525DCE|nr:hypothetical protein [Streptomyces salinarius]